MRKTIPLMAAACLLFFAQSCKRDKMPVDNISRVPDSKKQVTVDEMTGTLANGVFRFVTHNTAGLSPQKALGPVGGSAAVANAQMRQKGVVHSNMGQAWRLKLLTNGKYQLICQNTFWALTVLYGQAVNGRALILVPANEADVAQQWIITYDSGTGSYRLKTALGKMVPTDPDYGLYVANNNEDAAITLGVLTDTKSLFKVYRTAYKDNEATNFFKRTSGWMHSDGANTVALSNNKVMWLMDDGGIDGWNGSTVPCGFQANNSVLLQPKNNWAPASTPTQLQPAVAGVKRFYFRPETGAGLYCWITTGFEYSGVVRVFCDILASPATAQNRSYWGKYNVASNTVTGYTRLPANVENGTVAWGTGFIVGTDNYVYAYGHKEIYVTQSLHVARIPKSNLDGAWEFWNGSGWTATESAAASIGTMNRKAFVCKVGSKYVAVSTELSAGCGGGTRIYTSWSNSVTGPFSAVKEVYRIDDRLNGFAPFFYWANAHPEYVKNVDGNSELLITYDINGYAKMFPSTDPPCVETCVGGRMDPNHFRPRGIRIPLRLIDSSFPQ